MRSTYKQLYYINRNKIKADGTTAIMCRVTIDGKAAVLATGLYCTPDEWNSKKGETLGFAHQFKHNLSYHQSRHTFGTLLVSAGVQMESIAKMMEHPIFVQLKAMQK